MGTIGKLGNAADAVQAAATAIATEIQGLRSVLVGVVLALAALLMVAVLR